MVGVTFFGNFDLASLSIWLFWLFFAGLVYYLQTENMREGYPLEKEDGTEAPNQGPFVVPAPKTFKLPFGRGEVVVPSAENEAAHRRDELPMARTAMTEGFPHAPVGDPLLAGVGPGAWTPRKDLPELDGEGRNKIQPMSLHEDFVISAGRDPRGMPVVTKDDPVVGTVVDIWVDLPEQLIRYLEVEFDAEYGGGRRLLPIHFCRIRPRYVDLLTLNSDRLQQIPTTKANDSITLLEEERIASFYGGGLMYS